MKKILFFLILFHASAGIGHALTCVPKTGNSPSATNYLKYWGGVLETYLQCGGSGGGFHICKNGVVVEGWDGNLHKCTKNGWETVDDIKYCEGELQEIEQKYNGLSNMGTLFANNQAPKSYLYYYDENEKDGYTAIKNYCKYDYNEFAKQLAKCTGDFLHWNDDDTVTLCDTSAASSSTESAPQQSTKLARTSKEINCKNTGGDRYDAKNNLCICNVEEKHLTQTTEQGYSICRCMDGYRRNNETNEATGECVYAPEIQTKIERDDMAMQRDAEDAYRNEYDNAQSWANKGVTAGATLMTGEGAMMAARAIAEKIADDDAEREMAEYVSTMKCEYGGGQSVNLGDTETLPGGNELANYYAEYKQLADKLKATKAALNLRPGIEAEVLYDRAETGLYQYQTAERQSGGFTSLSRALMNPEGADATAWNAQRTETNRDLLIGGALATVGLAGSYIANRAINKDHVKKYKELEEKFREIKIQLEHEYPEIFIPTKAEPVVVIEPESPVIVVEVPLTASEKTFDKDVDKTTFESGFMTLTKSGVDALKAAVSDVVHSIEDFATVDEINIIATGHTDPTKINPQWVSKLTKQYIDNIGPLPDDYNNKIDDNPKLSKARAKMVTKFLTEQFKESYPNVQITEEATGKGDADCTNKKPSEYSQCRKVEISIKVTGTTTESE